MVQGLGFKGYEFKGSGFKVQPSRGLKTAGLIEKETDVRRSSGSLFNPGHRSGQSKHQKSCHFSGVSYKRRPLAKGQPV